MGQLRYTGPMPYIPPPSPPRPNYLPFLAAGLLTLVLAVGFGRMALSVANQPQAQAIPTPTVRPTALVVVVTPQPTLTEPPPLVIVVTATPGNPQTQKPRQGVSVRPVQPRPPVQQGTVPGRGVKSPDAGKVEVCPEGTIRAELGCVPTRPTLWDELGMDMRYMAAWLAGR